MPVAPKPTRKASEPVAAGTHLGTLFQIIYVGTQQQEWEGTASSAPEVSLAFELPNEVKPGKEGEPSKPRIVSRKYTFSMGPKANLRKLVEGIEGVTLLDQEAYAYDLDSLIGRSCLLNLAITPKNYNKIVSAVPLMKGMPVPAQINPLLIFDVNKFDEVKFANLPEFMRDIIAASPEYANKDVEKEDTIQLEEKDNQKPKAVKVKKVAEPIPYPDEEIDPADIPF